jgi:gamma-glutamyl:cysteine ligase YbdK (ATP-grasp superfamily)
MKQAFKGTRCLRSAFISEATDSAVETVSDVLDLIPTAAGNGSAKVPSPIDDAYADYGTLQRAVEKIFRIRLLNVGAPLTAPFEGFAMTDDDRYKTASRYDGRETVRGLIVNAQQMHVGSFYNPDEAVWVANLFRRYQPLLMSLSACTPLIGDVVRDGEHLSYVLREGDALSRRPAQFERIPSVMEMADVESYKALVNRSIRAARWGQRKELLSEWERTGDESNLLKSMDHEWIRVSKQKDSHGNPVYTVEVRPCDPLFPWRANAAMTKLIAALAQYIVQEELPRYDQIERPDESARSQLWAAATRSGREGERNLTHWETGESLDRTIVLGELFERVQTPLAKLGGFDDTMRILERLAREPLAMTLLREHQDLTTERRYGPEGKDAAGWRGKRGAYSPEQVGLALTAFVEAGRGWDLRDESLPEIRREAHAIYRGFTGVPGRDAPEGQVAFDLGPAITGQEMRL